MEEKKKTCGGVSAVQNIQGLEMLKQHAHTCREVQGFFRLVYPSHQPLSPVWPSTAYHGIRESRNDRISHRIIEWFGLQRILKVSYFQLPATGRVATH